MKARKVFFILALALLSICLLPACHKRMEASVTTTPPTTGIESIELPLPTTAPIEAETKLTYKTLCRMLDEAEIHLMNNKTVKVASNFYTETFVEKQKLLENCYVTKKDTHFVFEDQTDPEIHNKLRYLVFLSALVDQYADSLIWCHYDLDLSTSTSGQIFYLLILFTDYKTLGYDTIKDYLDAGQPLQENMVRFSVQFSFPSILMYYRDGEYIVDYRVYHNNPAVPTLHNGRATEPSGYRGPAPGYSGDGIPPC